MGTSNITNTEPSQACSICGSTILADLRPGGVIHPEIVEIIRQKHPDWSESRWICQDDFETFRHAYVSALLTAEKGELSVIETEVLDSLREQEILSKNPLEDHDPNLTFGQRLADHIAAIGGSWNFIISFMGVMGLWITINTVVLITHPFDPYPFILLNLCLSCLAALQAPVIMMSQSRQESRDRLSARHDYQVNLKAELEIRHLHQKLDHLLFHQWERLIRLQEIQMELLNEVRQKKEP